MAIRAPLRQRRSALPRPVGYPESGQPVGETEAHFHCIRELTGVLEAHFADAPNVWVNGDIMLYYAAGDPKRRVSPDVYVVLGVPKLPMRRIYALWVEGKAPTVVFEITSRKTRREDVVVKRALYQQLGAEEYVLFDPLEEYLNPSLQLLTLVDGAYQPVAPNAAGRVVSTALGLELGRHGHRVGLYEPRTGQCLRTLREETLARREAETEIERLRAELARWRPERPQ